MPKMHGGQALVQSLQREGVRVVFGLPGAGQYEALDAIYETPEIRYISTRHEQAASYMADGYARVSGEVGTALVVPGPGFYNTTAGLATAHAVSSPILVITGAPHYSHGQGHDADDDLKLLRALTKWAGRAETPADIPGVVHEAFRRLKTGRRRPVVIEIASETFAAEADVTLLEPETYEPYGGSPDRLKHAARLLADAQRPVIWAGSGAVYSDATPVLQALAERLQAPVVTTRGGKGAISDRHPLSLGFAELRYKPLKAWLDERDVILAVGTGTGYGDRIGTQTVIRIDIDDAEIERKDHHSYGIAGDARVCLEALYRIVSAMATTHPNRAEEVRAINEARFDPSIQLQPQHDLLQAIRSAMPDDGILVSGMNQMGYYCRNYYPVYGPRTFLTASSHGTLGCVYPIALGAKVAQPGRAVVAISGDGGFLYNVQALATAVQYGINVVTVVFNDNAYGNVLRAQIETFDGRIIGTQLHNPDFAQLAEAFGARGVRAEGAVQLESAFREALSIEAPTLIEVPVDMMERQY